MQIVIDNTNFTYDIGCRVLKLKYETAPFSSLEDIWEDIVPITFKEIATEISIFFLNGIVTPKGKKWMDKYQSQKTKF